MIYIRKSSILQKHLKSIVSFPESDSNPNYKYDVIHSGMVNNCYP